MLIAALACNAMQDDTHGLSISSGVQLCSVPEVQSVLLGEDESLIPDHGEKKVLRTFTSARMFSLVGMAFASLGVRQGLRRLGSPDTSAIHLCTHGDAGGKQLEQSKEERRPHSEPCGPDLLAEEGRLGQA